MDMVDYFDAYVRCGLKPLPLYAGTKIPVRKDWQIEWTADKYRNYFLVTPNLNIGILLGDIIDVEGDDMPANERIFELARNTPHPMFRSNKSIHHLFISPDPKITVCKVGHIEFRGQRHQSAIPPSVHKSGIKYAWLKDSTFPPPPMPRLLTEFLFQHRQEIHRAKPRSNGKKSNHTATVCNKCERKVFVHKKRLVLEVKAFRTLDLKWTCQNCRTVDVRPLCRQIRQSCQDS